MAFSVIIGSVIATIFMLAAAITVGHKDGSSRAIGLVGPLIGVCSGVWFMGHVPEWVLWATVGTAVALFVVGLFMPDARDDGWHYSALLVGLLGNLLAWLVVLIGSPMMTIPVWLVVTLALIVVVVIGWRVFTRRGNPTTAPQKATN